MRAEIQRAVDSLTITGNVDTEWRAFVEARRVEELDAIIADEGLNPAATRQFIETAFRDGTVQSTGIAITRVLPAMSRFAGGGAHSAKKQVVLDKLAAFVERFFGLA